MKVLLIAVLIAVSLAAGCQRRWPHPGEPIATQDQPIRTGRAARGHMGAMLQDLNASLAESLGLERPRGALVSSVEPDGPADDAGIEPGDVILQLDDETIACSAQLSNRVAHLKPGSSAKMTRWRNRTSDQVVVRVAPIKDMPARITREGEGQVRADACGPNPAK